MAYIDSFYINDIMVESVVVDDDKCTINCPEYSTLDSEDKAAVCYGVAAVLREDYGLDYESIILPENIRRGQLPNLYVIDL